MKKIVIFGIGQAGELAHYYFTHDSGRRVAGFTVDAAYLTSASFCGLPLTPFEEVASAFPPEEHDCFVAVGYAGINQLRAKKVEEAKAKGYALAHYCSSRATVLTDAPLGENCFVLESSVIQPFSRIGRNVTLWGGFIGHHAVVGDHCFISGYVGGGVRIGRNCLIGVHALLRSHITVGENSVIGIGAVVQADVAPGSVLKGVAAEPATAPSHRLHRL